MLPFIGQAVIRAARSCGIRAIRNPFVPVKPLATAHLLRRPQLWSRYTEVKILRRYAAQFREMVAREGLVTTDGSFGVLVTGALDETLFRAIIGSIPEGTWEFVCHPGYNDAELDGVPTRLRSSREKELAVSDVACSARTARHTWHRTYFVSSTGRLNDFRSASSSMEENQIEVPEHL